MARFVSPVRRAGKSHAAEMAYALQHRCTLDEARTAIARERHAWAMACRIHGRSAKMIIDEAAAFRGLDTAKQDSATAYWWKDD